jgi:hypothetical protein
MGATQGRWQSAGPSGAPSPALGAAAVIGPAAVSTAPVHSLGRAYERRDTGPAQLPGFPSLAYPRRGPMPPCFPKPAGFEESSPVAAGEHLPRFDCALRLDSGRGSRGGQRSGTDGVGAGPWVTAATLYRKAGGRRLPHLDSGASRARGDQPDRGSLAGRSGPFSPPLSRGRCFPSGCRACSRRCSQVCLACGSRLSGKGDRQPGGPRPMALGALCRDKLYRFGG